MMNDDPKEAAQRALREVAATCPIGVYSHRKGGKYFVFAHSVDETKLTPLVHYYSFTKGTRWTRTISDFTSLVDGKSRFMREQSFAAAAPETMCSFCGKRRGEPAYDIHPEPLVRYIIQGPAVAICDACTFLCIVILAENGVVLESNQPPTVARMLLDGSHGLRDRDSEALYAAARTEVARPQCTGTLVHDEFTTCPVHDRHLPKTSSTGPATLAEANEILAQCAKVMCLSCMATNHTTKGHEAAAR